MQEIAELERRITAALERIGRGIERMGSEGLSGTGASDASVMTDNADLAALNEALDEERMANAQLQERLRVLRDKDVETRDGLNVRIAELTNQANAHSEENKTLRQQVSLLNEHIATLRESAMAGVTEPHHINRAMMTELESLRSARATEAEELTEIVATLTPLIHEVQNDA